MEQMHNEHISLGMNTKVKQAMLDVNQLTAFSSTKGRWKHCNFSTLKAHAWCCQKDLTQSSINKDLIPSFQGATIIILNGHFSSEYSNGINPDEITMHFDKITSNNLLNTDDDASLNMMHVNNIRYSLRIEIAKGAKLKKTINIVHVTTEDATHAYLPCDIKIILQQNASAFVRLYIHNHTEEPIWLHDHMYFELHKSAQLNYCSYINDKPTTCYNCHVKVTCDEDAVYKNCIVTSGLLFGYVNQQIYLNGSHSKCALYGYYKQHYNNAMHHRIKVHHLAKNSISTQFFRGLLYDKAKAFFESAVMMKNGATKAASSQMNNNLLLSNTASIKSEPILEIYEDDVSATHGATVGVLDEQILYYMMSRGLSKQASEKLIKKTFIGEILSEYHEKSDPSRLYEDIQQDIEQW